MGLPTSERLPNITELLGYWIIVLFFCFPVIAVTWPIILDIDPINRYLKEIIPRTPRKVIASIVFGLFGCIGANACGLFLLTVLIVCQTFKNRTEKKLKLSLQTINQDQQSKLTNYALQICKCVLLIFEWMCPKWKKN